MSEPLVTRVLNGFHDPLVAPNAWNALLTTGDSDVLFLTWQWQEAWWRSFGRGRLLLVAVEKRGRPIAIAPLFADSGMVFFVGSGGSDYLDFVGDVSDPNVLESLLSVAIGSVAPFLGFRLYHVPGDSRTGARLRAAGERLGLQWYDEGGSAAPRLSLSDPQQARAATQKESLRRHEAFFQRGGRLEVSTVTKAAAILPQLPEFFAQHIARWSATPHPSLFLDPLRRDFYARVTQSLDPTGWLRFTRVDWEDRTIAFHFGFCYRGSYLWYKPSFAIDLARHSPGEVLLRRLLLAAIAEGADTFDFGLGDETFKRRFATHIPVVSTWGLYPPKQTEPLPR